ncbi:MAG: raqprd family integrative conjugative element protein [Nevskiales bacterium]|nr:raqprd family integrative conjugative element protein [Nevskiales bacterium]
MGQTSRRAFTWHRSIAMLLVVSCSALQPAAAADDALEREQLAALVRQLDLIERLAEHTAHTAPQTRARYHFDYARLRADLKRVRAGVQDYLVPQRAQPRDPAPLAADYVRRDRTDEREGAFP